MTEFFVEHADGRSGESWTVSYADMTDDQLTDMAIHGDTEARAELRARAEPAVKATQPDVVKVRRRAVDDALGRLAAIPDVEPGLIAVPWRTAPRPKVPTEAWAASDLRLFFIEELTATQPTLTRENVMWHLEHLGQVGEGRNANPNILAVNAIPFIYDGHHRLAALWLLGVDATNCWRLDLQATVPADTAPSL